MSEFQNPEAQRLAEVAKLELKLDQLDAELQEILEEEESDERNLRRDQKQGEVEMVKAKLFEVRNENENMTALNEHVNSHKEEYEEFIEMGIPVDEYSVAFDVFQSEEIPEEYLANVREKLEEFGQVEGEE